MPALELIAGHVTAPGSTQTALTMATTGAATIRNNGGEGDIRLLQTWAKSQTAGVLRIKSPNLHDNVQGLRFKTVVSEVDPLLPAGFSQQLISQDQLTLDLSGSGTAGDIEAAAFLIWYESLPGIEGRFMTPDAVKSAIKNLVTVENTLSLGTSGGWSGEEAINAEFDLLKANVDYAILGFLTSAECLAIGYRGSEFGNLRIGGPGNEASKNVTRRWFVDQSIQNDLPLIPVFNSANESAVLLDGFQDENGTDVTVTTILAELG